MEISGPGGIRPSEGEGAAQPVQPPIKEHIELEATKDALGHVVHALQGQPKQSVDSFYRGRLNELNRELKALKKIQKLLTSKPKGYEEKLKSYLLEGETVEHLEKALPLEIHIVNEKLKAVQTARVLTENLD